MQDNTKRFYQIGGLIFCFDAPDFAENGFLSAFVTAPCTADITYTVKTLPSITMPEGEMVYDGGLEKYFSTADGLVRVFIDEKDGNVLMTDMPNGDGHDICFRADRIDYFGSNLALKLLNLPRTMLDRGGVFLHASFIDVGGEAVLFSAPKQTGKSTQAALWKQYRDAEIINGDRALIRRCGDRWYAYGSPYCGTSDICLNRALPLRAVVLPERADVSAVQKTGVRRALAAMLDGCTFDVWDRRQVDTVTDICASLITQIPFYTLYCTPDESAVTVLEEVL